MASRGRACALFCPKRSLSRVGEPPSPAQEDHSPGMGRGKDGDATSIPKALLGSQVGRRIAVTNHTTRSPRAHDFSDNFNVSWYLLPPKSVEICENLWTNSSSFPSMMSRSSLFSLQDFPAPE